MARGTGATTIQMLHAPEGAVYVWAAEALSYPKHLAHSLGRNDLEIVAPSWLSWDRWRGRRLSAIVVDHAAPLTDEQQVAVETIRAYQVQHGK